MKVRLGVFAGAAILIGSMAAASADVIPGPTLDVDGIGYTLTGLEFQALDNSVLTGFTFQNQGTADTIELTDTSGNILDSIDTPAGTPSDPLSVNWSLSAGQEYWLLQTTGSNELFASYNAPLPSDTDIEITQSGSFGYSFNDLATDNYGDGGNQYWAAFNNLATISLISPVPEPSSLPLILAGLGMIGGAFYFGRKKAKAI